MKLIHIISNKIERGRGKLVSFFTQNKLYFKPIISAILVILAELDRFSRIETAGFKPYTYVAVSCTLIPIISMESATRSRFFSQYK